MWRTALQRQRATRRRCAEFRHCFELFGSLSRTAPCHWTRCMMYSLPYLLHCNVCCLDLTRFLSFRHDRFWWCCKWLRRAFQRVQGQIAKSRKVRRRSRKTQNLPRKLELPAKWSRSTYKSKAISGRVIDTTDLILCNVFTWEFYKLVCLILTSYDELLTYDVINL